MPGKTLQLLLILHLALLPKLFSQTNEQLRDNLYAANADGSFSLNDGNLTMYSATNSNLIDGMDAVKMSNFGENLGLQRGTTTLAIERRQSIETSDTIFFKMWNMRQKTYKLELIVTGLNKPGFTGVLEDSYLNTKTDVDLNGLTNATFDITNVPGSYAANRFRVIISSPRTAFSLLPITFTGIKAYQKNDQIDIEWSVENEKNILRYQVQKSINGMQFTTASIIPSKSNGSSSYKWTDISLTNETNFYRIAGIDINGRIEYSNVAKVATVSIGPSISVYPNPVVNGILNLQLVNQLKGIYSARIYNNFGQLIHVSQLKHDGGNATKAIQVSNSLSKGSYHLEVISPDNKKIHVKILAQ